MNTINKINRLNEVLEYKYNQFSKLMDKVLLGEDVNYNKNLKDKVFTEITQLQTILFELEEEL